MKTYKDALEAVENLKTAHSTNTPLNLADVETLVSSIGANVQMRDYIMGELPIALGAEHAISLVTDILPLVAEADRVAFYSVLSTFYLELGDNELAYASILQAKALDPDYSLANLLERVINAGWTPESMVAMRNELHPRVMVTIHEMADEVFA